MASINTATVNKGIKLLDCSDGTYVLGVYHGTYVKDHQ